jgi:purine nucleoside phosphorylase
MENREEIDYEEIPHFPVSTVSGHAGSWFSGKIEEFRLWQCREVSMFLKDILTEVVYPI